ncbi:MAG TPA: hypothetical protein VFA15_07205, partial [Nitrososphaera sp.]|nr:hypothetical protein [Nitrososphaera sp.]
MHEDPLVHYITRGSSMGYEPNALFDSNHYRQYYAASGLLAHMPLLSANPLLHFITTGSAEGIEANAVFDTSYYLNRYPDVKNLGITALAHYLKEGAVQGRDPSAHFSTSFYLEQYPDVKAAGMNPLAHYIRHGAAEGRNPSPTFNTSFYLSQNADVRASSINPLAHYETYGICEGRAPLPQTAELAAAIESISEHYLLARQIEPALPPLSSLASLQAGCLPKSSRTGAAYFKMAAALTRPFTHLFLLSGRGWDKAAELALRFCDATVKRSGPDSVLLICTDGRDPSIRQRIPDEVRIVYFEELERRLDERARLTLLTRLA